MGLLLIETCPEKNLPTTTDGRPVKNWHAINRDSKRLEKICRGKVPESSNVLCLLSQEFDLNVENSELARTSTLVRNRYKRPWRERKVLWPSAMSTASSSTSSFCCNQSTANPTPYFSQSSVIGLPQKEHTADALYEQQDDLNLKESIKTQCAVMHTLFFSFFFNFL